VYRAPELSRSGASSHSTAADAYAFGILAWELCQPQRVAELAGRGGYSGANDSSCILNANNVAFPAETPLNLELLVLACLSAEPAERPSLQAAAEVLQSVLADVAAMT
jgi:Protein tyrosine and serine/threonine kinase